MDNVGEGVGGEHIPVTPDGSRSPLRELVRTATTDSGARIGALWSFQGWVRLAFCWPPQDSLCRQTACERLADQLRVAAASEAAERCEQHYTSKNSVSIRLFTECRPGVSLAHAIPAAAYVQHVRAMYGTRLILARLFQH